MFTHWIFLRFRINYVPTYFLYRNNEIDMDANEVWSHHLDELGDRLNQDNDRASFLRMVNRNHLLNSSNYSLSSLFRYEFWIVRLVPCIWFGYIIEDFACSVGSLSGSVASGSTSRHGSVRASRMTAWQGHACLTALYQMLIAPFEEYLSSVCQKENTSGEFFFGVN